MEDKKLKVLALATELAMQASEEYGIDYSEAIDQAIEEACTRLRVSEQDRNRLFR